MIAKILIGSLAPAAAPDAAGERGAPAGKGSLRRRLFLVHGAALRETGRRQGSAVGLYRRPHGRTRRTSRCPREAPAISRPSRCCTIPSKISYEQLLDVFWRQINPTDAGGQFVDRGSSYLSAIFYQNEEQRKLAEESKRKLEQSGRFDGNRIVTAIRPAGPFYPAEEYHQDYWKKNPIRYKFYRFNSGRDQYLEKVWGKEKDMQTARDRTPNRLLVRKALRRRS